MANSEWGHGPGVDEMGNHRHTMEVVFGHRLQRHAQWGNRIWFHDGPESMAGVEVSTSKHDHGGKVSMTKMWLFSLIILESGLSPGLSLLHRAGGVK